jgi:hypothetical protein
MRRTGFFGQSAVCADPLIGMARLPKATISERIAAQGFMKFLPSLSCLASSTEADAGIVRCCDEPFHEKAGLSIAHTFRNVARQYALWQVAERPITP